MSIEAQCCSRVCLQSFIECLNSDFIETWVCRLLLSLAVVEACKWWTSSCPHLGKLPTPGGPSIIRPSVLQMRDADVCSFKHCDTGCLTAHSCIICKVQTLVCQLLQLRSSLSFWSSAACLAASSSVLSCICSHRLSTSVEFHSLDRHHSGQPSHHA